DRAVQAVLQRHPVGPPPHQLPFVRPGVQPHPQLHVVVDQPAQHPMQGAELGELGEDQPHHRPDLLVGVQHRLSRHSAQIADRQPHGQLSPPRLGLLAGQHPLLEQGQLGLAHRPLQPQQQPVVELHRLADPFADGSRPPPRVLAVTNRWKPPRPTALAPDLPRSSSITSTREPGQPTPTARSPSPYCSRVDSPWSSTCWRVDWRTYTTASRSSCRSLTLLPSRCHGNSAVPDVMTASFTGQIPDGDARPPLSRPPPPRPSPPSLPPAAPTPGSRAATTRLASTASHRTAAWRLASGSPDQHWVAAPWGARVSPRPPRPALRATRAGSQPLDALDQPQQPLTSEYRRLPHLVSIHRRILLGGSRSASRPPRAWSAWTPIRSAAGVPGTAGPPWPCSPTPSSWWRPGLNRPATHHQQGWSG